ncbi:hypothetical protein SCUCBS95973_007220 [Sporothrix curviconia]|uniref:Uncharacterized protein n=1 Tax=Sporothrix curviconia TaxID=1260050 RepID=A0ABP0CBL8_9PEZI
MQQQTLEKQKKQQEEEAASNAVKSSKKANTSRRAASTVVPTRIQPSRAAKAKNNKRKAEEMDNTDETIAPAVSKKAKTGQTATPTAEEDYTLDPASAKMAIHTFQEKMDTLLEGRRDTLARTCFWSTAMAKPPAPSSVPCVNHWCPIVAAPLSCNDNKYCSHGMSLSSSSSSSSSSSTVSSSCPVAVMAPSRTLQLMGPPRTPSPTPSTSTSSSKSTTAAGATSPMTPPPMASVRFQAKPFAEQQHIQARTVELAGLRFAVDLCNGMLRVCMV